jgi:hypothetical protein
MYSYLTGWDCGSGGEDDDDYFKPSAFKEAIVSASMHVGGTYPVEKNLVRDA